jgi:hypothetical protein
MQQKPKRPRDPNQLGKSVIDVATGSLRTDPSVKKNPAAEALGRLGGHKGGKARATKLSAKQRTEIAKKAALARWMNRSR